MTTTYQVKPTPYTGASLPYQVIECTLSYITDVDRGLGFDKGKEEMVFEGNLADCAAFIQLRKNGHI